MFGTSLLFGGLAKKIIDPYNIEYLVVAGGGGAYYSGGGGGGYRTNVVGDLSGANSPAESSFISVIGQVYPILIGAGGAGSHQVAAANLKGGDSSFDTITSIGGGKGSNLWNGNGFAGGSGGGANVLEGSDAFRSGGAGTAGQGFRGGNAANGTGTGDVTAGGGGAGGQGQDKYNDAGWAGSLGGAGLISSIDGLSQTRSKGGDGGVSTPANPYGANTGAGGQSVTSSGQSGVVILRVPTASFSGITTGSPVITNQGDFTVLTYNGSGTYTG